MPEKKKISPITIVVAIVIVFLIGKFLGLLQILDIDPFGLEPEWVYGVIAIGIGVLYKEIRDLGKEVRERDFKTLMINYLRLERD